MKCRLPKVIIVFLFLSTSLYVFPSYTKAEDEEVSKFPNRPVTFVFPYPAGVAADIRYRALCREAEKFLGQPIVVVNKSGGGGTVGMAALAVSKPDGYTIGQNGGSAIFVTPYLEKVPYHPIKDFRRIIGFTTVNYAIVVRYDSPFKTFPDLISFARKNPYKLTYGTSGTADLHHLILEEIARKEKVEFTHIPYKGTSESEMALLGGHIQVAAGDFSQALVEAKKTRMIALFRPEKSDEYPDVPLLKDYGYTFPFPTFGCIACPRAVHEGIVKKLEVAFTKATKEPAFIKAMKELRCPILYRNSQETEDYVVRNYELMGKMIRDAGLIK